MRFTQFHCRRLRGCDCIGEHLNFKYEICFLGNNINSIQKTYDIQLHKIKAQLYKRKFQTVGKGLYIVGRPLIHGKGKILAGTNLYLNSLSCRIEIFAGENAEIRLGNNVIINQGVDIGALQRIEIGDETMIGDQTTVFDSDFHGIDGNPIKTSPVIIGKHVWICAKVIILKGVSIGDNSIVGAGSVVTKDIENNTIVVGNPAKKIGITRAGYT